MVKEFIKMYIIFFEDIIGLQLAVLIQNLRGVIVTSLIVVFLCVEYKESMPLLLPSPLYF